MRVLLLLNGPRERYVGGADSARQLKWRDYCSPVTQLEIGYLPSIGEGGGGANVYAFGTRDALTLGPLYPDVAQRRNGMDSMRLSFTAS